MVATLVVATLWWRPHDVRPAAFEFHVDDEFRGGLQELFRLPDDGEDAIGCQEGKKRKRPPAKGPSPDGLPCSKSGCLIQANFQQMWDRSGTETAAEATAAASRSA